MEDAAAIENMAATAKSLAAARVAETGVWKKSGDRTPAHELARRRLISASSVGLLSQPARV